MQTHGSRLEVANQLGRSSKSRRSRYTHGLQVHVRPSVSTAASKDVGMTPALLAAQRK